MHLAYIFSTGDLLATSLHRSTACEAKPRDCDFEPAVLKPGLHTLLTVRRLIVRSDEVSKLGDLYVQQTDHCGIGVSAAPVKFQTNAIIYSTELMAYDKTAYGFVNKGDNVSLLDSDLQKHKHPLLNT